MSIGFVVRDLASPWSNNVCPSGVGRRSSRFLRRARGSEESEEPTAVGAHHAEPT
jgi:hypothetical protein